MAKITKALDKPENEDQIQSPLFLATIIKWLVGTVWIDWLPAYYIVCIFIVSVFNITHPLSASVTSGWAKWTQERW